MRRIDDGIWVVERPFKLFGAEFGNRMTVIRLADGKLLLHSPVSLDPQLRAEVEALGPVEYLLTPNTFHGLHVGQWSATYPHAHVFDARDERTLSHFAPMLEMRQVKGISKLNEVACYHSDSRTLILTDLCFNIGADVPAWTKLFFSLNGAYNNFGPSRMMRSMIDDRESLLESVTEILSWPFERVIVSHGEVIEHNGQKAMREAFAFLGQDQKQGSRAAGSFPLRCG